MRRARTTTIQSLLWFRPRITRVGLEEGLMDNSHLTHHKVEDWCALVDAVDLRLRSLTHGGSPLTGRTVTTIRRMCERASHWGQMHAAFRESLSTIAGHVGCGRATLDRVNIRAEFLGLYRVYNRPLRAGGHRKQANLYFFPEVPTANSEAFGRLVTKIVNGFLLRLGQLRAAIETRLAAGRTISGRLRRYQMALGLAPTEVPTYELPQAIPEVAERPAPRPMPETPAEREARLKAQWMAQRAADAAERERQRRLRGLINSPLG